MEEVLRILQSIRPGVDFTKEEHLVEDHLLTSLEIMMLVPELNEAFDIEISLPYIRPENFSSAQAIYAMVQRVQEDD